MKDKAFVPIGVMAFVALMVLVGRVFAAEGGYSNYVPGTYGDCGIALAPADSWTLRNYTYFYGAEIDESLRSGTMQLDTDLDFLMNFTTLLYKSDFELLGGDYAGGIFMPIVNLDIKTDIALGYIYNTENDDTDYQTGQELHVVA